MSMAKKNLDILLGNIIGSDVVASSGPEEQSSNISADPVNTDHINTKYGKNPSEIPWRHFSFICSKELVDKVQAIARKEGFTIRSFMEYVIGKGIEAYETKHGKVKRRKPKGIHEVM